MGSRTTYLGYRMLSRAAEILPRSAVLPLSRQLAALATARPSAQRELVAKHLERVTGQAPGKHLLRQTYASYIRFWLESFRLPVVPREQLDASFTMEGREHIEAALAQGKGVILALPHVGNWDVAGAWLVQHVTPLTVVVEELEPPELFTWFKQFRESFGLRVLTNSPRVGTELLAALHDNHAIALLSDRDVDGTGGEYKFFGEVTRVPRGPATLALRSGAPILPVATYENGAGFRTVVRPALDTERRGKLSEDVDRVTRDLLAEFERLIRNAPAQWHLFQPNWPSDRT